MTTEQRIEAYRLQVERLLEIDSGRSNEAGALGVEVRRFSR